MSTADLIFGDNRKNQEKFPNYRNLAYVTVSSPEISWAYEEAMNLKNTDTQIVSTGISRTDVFYDKNFIEAAAEAVYSVCPKARSKKIILYAPTFRGRVAKAQTPDCLDIAAMKEALGDEYFLLLKHHPFVKKRPEIPEDCQDFAMDVTKELDIDKLLCVSDVCISDYSSLIFEYSLFERPMIFFAYDLDEYFDWRGFYYNYDELTPGPSSKQPKKSSTTSNTSTPASTPPRSAPSEKNSCPPAMDMQRIGFWSWWRSVDKNFIKKMITPGCWIPASRGVVLFCIKFVFQNGSINTSYLYQVIIHRYIGTFLKKCL